MPTDDLPPTPHREDDSFHHSKKKQKTSHPVVEESPGGRQGNVATTTAPANGRWAPSSFAMPSQNTDWGISGNTIAQTLMHINMPLTGPWNFPPPPSLPVPRASGPDTDGTLTPVFGNAILPEVVIPLTVSNATIERHCLLRNQALDVPAEHEKENERKRKHSQQVGSDMGSSQDSTPWKCPHCSHEQNPHDESECQKCKKRRGIEKGKSLGWSNALCNQYSGKWQCTMCSLWNEDKTPKKKCKFSAPDSEDDEKSAAVEESAPDLTGTSALLSEPTTLVNENSTPGSISGSSADQPAVASLTNNVAAPGSIGPSGFSFPTTTAPTVRAAATSSPAVSANSSGGAELQHGNSSTGSNE